MYQITGKIGKGGMGAIFKGVDTMLDSEVAIKTLARILLVTPNR